MIFRELTSYTATALNNTFDWDVSDADSLSIQLTGTGWTGTISFYGSLDSSNTVPLALEDSSSTTPATRVVSATASGLYTIDTKGLKRFRAICTAFTGGTMLMQVRTARGM